MSVTSDLAGAFAERELTVPLQYGGQSTRAFEDVSGEAMTPDGARIQTKHRVLNIATSSLTDVVEDTDVTVGVVGAATADGGVTCRIRQIDPLEDGFLTRLIVVEVPA